jgi:hypothetical protein
MATESTPQSLLQQLAQIQHMDRGSVCVIRQGPGGPYYNHQCHEQGRNVSRYVPREQVPALKEAIEGYHRFERLMGQYVQLMVDKTRAERQAGLKKKRPRHSSSSPRKRKSSS